MDLRELSASETEIMREVWSVDEDLQIGELTERILEKYGKEHKPSTMRTFLARLLEKKYITTYRIGRYSFVHAEISEEEYKEMLATKQVNLWHHGSLADFFCAFKNAEKISKEEAQKIRELIDGMEE